MVGAAATAVLVAVAAWSSADRPPLRALWRSLRPAVGIPVIQGRLLLGLVSLGVVAGIPLALGLFGGNVLTLMGALAACMLGRGLGSGDRSLLSRSGLPFLIVCWSIAAAAGRFQTLDIGAVMGAHSVLGWGPDDGGAWTASLAGGVLGLLGAAAWTASLPEIGGSERTSADRLLRAGEAALAASAVAATVWGPSLGALVRGPLDADSLALTAASFAVTAASVAVVSRLRAASDLLLRPMVVGTLAALSLAVLMAIELRA